MDAQTASLFAASTDPLSGRVRFAAPVARSTDPDTSHANANAAEQERATRLVLQLMADGVARIDNEIAREIRNATPDRLRHGRKAAFDAGYLVATGRKRPTGNGRGTATEWVASARLYAITPAGVEAIGGGS